MKLLRALIPKRVKRKVWAIAGELLALNKVVASGHEVRIRSYSDWCLYNDIFVDGEYDRAIHAAIRHWDRATVFQVVDLGGNVGLFTARVLSLLPAADRSRAEVLIIEPSSSLLKRQRDLFARQDSPPHVRIVRGLVGNRSGKAHLQIQHEQLGNVVTTSAGADTEEVEYVDVEALTRPDAPIALLKCDIEGSEGLFIANYQNLLRRTKVAVFEFHAPACTVESVTPAFLQLGFGAPEQLRDAGANQTWCFERQT